MIGYDQRDDVLRFVLLSPEALGEIGLLRLECIAACLDASPRKVAEALALMGAPAPAEAAVTGTLADLERLAVVDTNEGRETA